jgi:hypothetical protein
MKKIILFTILLGLVFAGNAYAEEKMVFDSTDHYLGACQLTNKSEWTLKEDINVSKFEVWYNWNQGETSLPVKVFFNGEKFAEFEATRAACDPYQHQWCNADYQISKLFQKGTYTTEIPNARQCLKPGGTGAIRLYTDEISSESAKPTITIAPTVIEPTVKQAIVPVAASDSKQSTCSCTQTTIILTAAATSVISSFLTSLFLKKVVK